jgi:phosphatidylglycerophosphatase A
MQPLHPVVYIGLLLVLGYGGVWLATVTEPEFGEKDPGAIVIDEIIAFPLTMFLIPLSAGTLALGFFLNRLMDTVKFWPCDDLQRLPGGWGIMLDDMVAAVYSCALMHLAIHYWPNLLTFHPL